MSRAGRAGPALVLAALMACAPAPKDDGGVLTLPPPATTSSTSTTTPGLSTAARIQLRTSGPVNKLMPMDGGSVCIDDRMGTLEVRGTASDGTVLEVTLLRPAVGRYPVAVASTGAIPEEPPSPTVSRLSLRLQGKDYSRPSGGQISIADARGRWGTVVAEAFVEDPSLKMTADWVC